MPVKRQLLILGALMVVSLGTNAIEQVKAEWKSHVTGKNHFHSQTRKGGKIIRTCRRIEDRKLIKEREIWIKGKRIQRQIILIGRIDTPKSQPTPTPTPRPVIIIRGSKSYNEPKTPLKELTKVATKVQPKVIQVAPFKAPVKSHN